MKRTTFNEIFKQTMDKSGVSSSELATLSGRSRVNVSEIRNGKSFPTIGDFCELLSDAEKLSPGFCDLFGRLLVGETRRQTLNPEELINSLDSTELAALFYAAGNRIADSSGRNDRQVLRSA